MADWKTYRKTATADAIRVEQLEDLQELLRDRPDVDAEWHAKGGEPTGRVEIDTAEGTVTVEPPFYLCRGPEDELWPVKVEKFQAWYERAYQGDTVLISRDTARAALIEIRAMIRRTKDEDPDPLSDSTFQARDELEKILEDEEGGADA